MMLQQELVQDERFKEAFKGVTIYGVAGANASGKDTVLEVLEEAGYHVFNASDALRKISKAALGSTQRGGNDSPTGRIANAQRSLYPGGMVALGLIEYWARVLHMPEELHPKGIAIGSIRAVGEVKGLKNFGGKLIAVNASVETRYNRIVKRARTYEAHISIEQFIEEEKAEMAVGETDPTKFGMAQVIEMADITIDNDQDDIAIFKDKIKQALSL